MLLIERFGDLAAETGFNTPACRDNKLGSRQMMTGANSGRRIF